MDKTNFKDKKMWKKQNIHIISSALAIEQLCDVACRT